MDNLPSVPSLPPQDLPQAPGATGDSAGVNAKPALSPDTEGVWERALSFRNRLYDAFNDACRKHKLNGRVLRSPPHEIEPWVSFEGWVPAERPHTAERRGVVISIHTKPYHEFECEFHVSLTNFESDSGLEVVLEKYPASLPEHIVGMVADKAWKIDFSPWKPVIKENKIRNLHATWQETLGMIMFLTGVGAAIAGLMALPYGEAVLLYWGPALVLLLLGYIMALRSNMSSKVQLVRTVGRPAFEARYLRRADSWQTIVNDLGNQAEELKKHLTAQLRDGEASEFKFSTEKIGYLRAGYQDEREQMVLTFRRGIIFVQVYVYGSDLYIGWDAHLNLGEWDEVELAAGFDRSLRRNVSVRTVIASIASANEYDMVDLNCLTEWTHARIVKTVKQMLKEHQINQEIDFKILRQQRTDILDEERSPERQDREAQRSPAKAPMRLKRTG